MSIPRRSKCAKLRESAGRVRRVAPASAFTLIELLVVIAIIAVLMSILLPSLNCAREQARASVCGQRLRDYGTGLATYFAENKDWIPGANTSGFEVYALQGTPGGWNNPRVPVQTYDWMTPVLSRSMTLQQQRAKRFKELQNVMGCPSQKFYRSVLFGLSAPETVDRGDFAADPEGWTALSYLMPVQFQYWGQNYRGRTIGPNRVNPNDFYPVQVAPADWEVLSQDYKSIMTQVGNAARKVAVADGTRYLPDTLLLDHDVNPRPGTFGSFTSSGAWWGGDTAYGVRQGSAKWTGGTVPRGSPSRGRNLTLSYRHGCQRSSSGDSAQGNKSAVNALYFDGHVGRLLDRESRNPVLWYPKGSVVRDANECMTNELANNDLIP